MSLSVRFFVSSRGEWSAWNCKRLSVLSVRCHLMVRALWLKWISMENKNGINFLWIIEWNELIPGWGSLTFLLELLFSDYFYLKLRIHLRSFSNSIFAYGTWNYIFPIKFGEKFYENIKASRKRKWPTSLITFIFARCLHNLKLGLDYVELPKNDEIKGTWKDRLELQDGQCRSSTG